LHHSAKIRAGEEKKNEVVPNKVLHAVAETDFKPWFNLDLV
jgi:hypothetical protein